eukprot:gene12708-3724_t
MIPLISPDATANTLPNNIDGSIASTLKPDTAKPRTPSKTATPELRFKKIAIQMSRVPKSTIVMPLPDKTIPACRQAFRVILNTLTTTIARLHESHKIPILRRCHDASVISKSNCNRIRVTQL